MSTNQPPKRCGLATTSLVLGIIGLLLGFFVVGILLAIPAIMVARRSLTKIHDSSGSLSGGQLALVALKLGYVGISISFTAFLFLLLLPALPFPPPRAPITFTLSKGRQIYLAMYYRAKGELPVDKVSEWPQSTLYSSSTSVFTNLVGSETIKTDYSFFAAPGLKAYKGTNAGLFTAENNAWCVVADVKDSDPDQMPVLFTRNLKIDSLAEFKGTGQLSDDPPFGRKCVLVIFNGGEAMVLKPDVLASNFNIGHATNRVLRP
jgi:hypothetical protein